MDEYAYDQQIEINADGITIGGTRVPGLIDAGSVNVSRAANQPGHWIVTASFVTSREPTIGAGAILDPTGRATPVIADIDHP